MRWSYIIIETLVLCAILVHWFSIVQCTNVLWKRVALDFSLKNYVSQVFNALADITVTVHIYIYICF